MIKRWWVFNRPAGKVLCGIVDNEVKLRIFVKDLLVPENTPEEPKLFSMEGLMRHINPNISIVLPEVEAIGMAKLLNVLGRLGKKDKIDIVKMSEGFHLWDSNLIVLGAQSGKSREFYEIMEHVGYEMDDANIYDRQNGDVIQREEGYGYGLIIKAKNKKLPEGRRGLGILLGGFGTLGTETAIHYFCQNIAFLGKEFGKDYFSLVVRARVNSGCESVERVGQYDKSFIFCESKMNTIVVSINEEKFKRIFLGNNEWFPVRIPEDKVKDIKYVAIYRSAPVSAITHCVQVSRIDPCEKEGEYKLVFSCPAIRLEKSIPFGNAQRGFMKTQRYTSLQKLERAKQITELFVT